MLTWLQIAVLLYSCSIVIIAQHYKPTWDSLDKRPLPDWYDKAKIGIFIHWGIFSVPSFESEWFWWYWQGDPSMDNSVSEYMKKNYAPNYKYEYFAQQFKAEFFNPDDWAQLFADSGAKYVVLTSKHHEGFCNWPSNTSWQWNSVNTGPGKDLVGDLAQAIRNKTNLRFGLYHSLFEWFNPTYRQDKASNWTTQEFISSKIMPELYDLVRRYKPEIIWSDGDNGPYEYWNSTNFLAWLYNESPVKNTVVTNDRWGTGCSCNHGGFYTCVDRFHPQKLMNHKWENCMTLDRRSWGYRRDTPLKDIFSIKQLIEEVIFSVAMGGNILINVGPTSWGTIAPIYEERLKQLGIWLRVNGEAIYETQPWRIQNESESDFVWYTSKLPVRGQNPTLLNRMQYYFVPQNMPVVYALLTKWPNKICSFESIFETCNRTLYLSSPIVNEKYSKFILFDGTSKGIVLNFMLGKNETYKNGVTLFLPDLQINDDEKQNLLWAWTIKMTNIL